MSQSEHRAAHVHLRRAVFACSRRAQRAGSADSGALRLHLLPWLRLRSAQRHACSQGSLLLCWQQALACLY